MGRVTVALEGLESAPGFVGRRRLFRYDDMERVLGAEIQLRGGERLRVPSDVARTVEAILAGPPRKGALPELGRAFAAHLAGPHGARRAAERLVEIAEGSGASDVHLEPLPEGASIRLRLLGDLVDLCPVPAAAAPRLVAALKGWAGCLPYRSDVVQEGRIPRSGVAADLRGSFIPTPFGDRAALRLFGRLLSLEELGLDPSTRNAFESALAVRTGLVLVAGGTGAGKTTTLYAALAHVAAARQGAHLSLEDPVEQRLRMAGIPVDQVELDPAQGRTGEAILAAALRQDVDVISVGEIRTPAEARLAVQAARTGRLVLAGVHAGSCAEAQARLRDLGAEDKDLTAVLRAVLYQALVTEPCGCSSPHPCPPPQGGEGGEGGGGEAGCNRCRGLGRRRRPAARLEILRPEILEVVA